MGRKYIVEVEDETQIIIEVGANSTGAATIASNPISFLKPYTEPDLDAIRKWAYDKGYCDAAYNCHETCDFLDDEKKESYQRGLNDAWEAAKKIGSNSMCSLKEMGFDFGQCVVNDYNPSWFVVKNYSASECIEKIRQYEQEKEEQIQVGDEVIYDGKRCVVVFPQTEHLQATVLECGRFHHTHVVEYDELTQTGRHVPELVEILQKMKEES